MASTYNGGLYIFAFRYLQIEWDLKKARTEGSRIFEKSSMKGATPGCPQQSNSSDCGIYVLHYIETFFKVSSCSKLPIVKLMYTSFYAIKSSNLKKYFELAINSE